MLTDLLMNWLNLYIGIYLKNIDNMNLMNLIEKKNSKIAFENISLEKFRSMLDGYLEK